MKEEEKMLCDFMANFFESHFNNITYDLSGSNIEHNKDVFVELLKSSPEDAVWALTELCWWGMDKQYLNEIYEYKPEDHQFYVLKINGRYIRLSFDDKYDYDLRFVEPKIKTVTYFD